MSFFRYSALAEPNVEGGSKQNDNQRDAEAGSVRGRGGHRSPLKVDVDALPMPLRNDIARRKINLDDPATTVALLKLNSVVGVTGYFNKSGQLQSMGVQCALCHSTVDDSFAPGIGRRLDGWANRDLNIGAIIALAPDLTVVTKLLGVGDSTVTGFGSTTYWNAFVANLEMHGRGTFYDPRLSNYAQFPVAAKAGSNDVRRDSNAPGDPDLVTSKLAALHFYQLAIPAPKPAEPGGPSNVAAIRGEAVFNGRAQCARCHVAPLFTEPGFNMHTPEEIGIDDFQANRSPTKMYRTAPLKGLMTHQKGGFYHDGRFPTLETVIDHYDNLLRTALTNSEKSDLIAYLRSL
jgi:hypothetical protein